MGPLRSRDRPLIRDRLAGLNDAFYNNESGSTTAVSATSTLKTRLASKS